VLNSSTDFLVMAAAWQAVSSIVVLTSWSWPLLGRLYHSCGGDVKCK